MRTRPGLHKGHEQVPVMENGNKVRIRLIEDFRGGADGRIPVKMGAELDAICSCPAAGFRGYAAYEIKRHGSVWIIPESKAEIIGWAKAKGWEEV